MLQTFRKRKQRGLLFHSLREGLFGALAVRDVVLHADGAEELARIVAHARGGHGGPDISAVLAAKTLLDGIAINLARKLTAELLAVISHIRRQGFLEDRSSQEFGGGIAKEPAKLLIDREHPPVLVDLEDSGTDVLIARGGALLVARVDQVHGACSLSLPSAIERVRAAEFGHLPFMRIHTHLT